MPIASPVPPIVVQKKRGWGCWGCGCSALAAAVLLLIALIAAGCYFGYHAALRLTDTAPISVPQFDGGEPVFLQAHQKIEDFQQAFERNQGATLRLNSDEINTLIARDPTCAQIRGHLFVTLKGDEATVQTGLPLGSFEKVFLADRYVNGEATFALGFDPQDRAISIDLRHMQIKSENIPAQSAENFSMSLSRMINQQAQQNQIAKDLLARTQKIAIENGELVIQTQ